MNPLDLVDDWPVNRVSVAMVGPGGAVTTIGDTTRPYPLASVSKLLTAAAVLIAHDEGTIDLETPIDDLAGATGADVLAHCSGLGPDDETQLMPARRRRVYSNRGYQLMAEQVAAGAGFDFGSYLAEAVLEPASMTDARLVGSPAAGVTASLRDLIAFVEALRGDGLLSPDARARFTNVHRPELDGVLPGFGRQRPNPWGQGAEIRGQKSPHWTASGNSIATWGHFGQSGTFLWTDPGVAVSLVVLTDEPFGSWAKTHWPVLGDAVLDTLA